MPTDSLESPEEPLLPAPLVVPRPAVQPDLLVQIEGLDRRLEGGSTYRIGRDPESDIVMTAPRVSWQHGILRVDEGAWVFEDLGSRNGTFLGAERLARI